MIGLVRATHTALWSLRKTLAEAWQSTREYQADALLIRGPEKHSGAELRLFYFGTRDNLDLLLERIYSDCELAEQGTDLNALTYARWLDRCGDAAELLVVDINWPFCELVAGPHWMRLPPWVDMSVTLEADWEATCRKFRRHVRRSDLKLVRKLGLTYDITSGEQALREFYHSMYLPYVQQRFGNGAFVEPEDRIISKTTLRNGRLLRILRDQTVVAAGMMLEWNGELSCAWLGMPEGIDSEMTAGAMDGLYYFNLLYAFERGCKTVKFFGCRPFLNDGALRFKRKWGASLGGRWAIDGSLLFQVARAADSVRSFFVHSPLISCRGTKLTGRVLLDQRRVSADDVARALELHDTVGLESVRIYALHGFEDGVQATVPDSVSPVRLIDLAASSDPLGEYCR